MACIAIERQQMVLNVYVYVLLACVNLWAEEKIGWLQKRSITERKNRLNKRRVQKVLCIIYQYDICLSDDEDLNIFE